MSNNIFPRLIGLSYPVLKEPVFSTIVHENTSGLEARIALWNRPRKKWTLTFNYLAQSISDPLAWSQNDLRALMGFQMAHYGKWDSFLYDDPTDNVTQGAAMLNTVTFGTAGDGVTTDFQLQRGFGTALESVYDLNPTGVSSARVNSGGSGYTFAYLMFSGGDGQGAAGYAVIGSGAIDRVVLTSSGYGYTSAPNVTVVGDGTGASVSVSLSPVVYLNDSPTGGYSISPTGLVTFSSPPGLGTVPTADFAYYWRCRFNDDSVEFSNDYRGYWACKKIVLYQARG